MEIMNINVHRCNQSMATGVVRGEIQMTPWDNAGSKIGK